MGKSAGKKRFRSQGSLQQEVAAGLGSWKGAGWLRYTGGGKGSLEGRIVTE